mgnify:CR=1 FL=1
MGFFEVLMIAIGLSMDAFAVAVCKGLATDRFSSRAMLRVGVWFGSFQALMPLFGYFLGSRFEKYIVSFDHWIAFALLSVIGFNMIRESRECEGDVDDDMRVTTMLLLAVATSIDALAVGISFAFLQGTSVSIYTAISLIGIITLVLSSLGFVIGNRFGTKYKSRAEAAGGIILILMGLKILLEHLGII